MSGTTKCIHCQYLYEQVLARNFSDRFQFRSHPIFAHLLLFARCVTIAGRSDWWDQVMSIRWKSSDELRSISDEAEGHLLPINKNEEQEASQGDAWHRNSLGFADKLYG